jgi:pimeloyl-ACP methyl ester carboxylesterase
MGGLRGESLFVRVGARDELHLRHIWQSDGGPPVLMLHGSIENGRVFYSFSGKGLAPFLAGRGFDVYVADLRGRGESRPPIGPGSQYGQTEAITEDVPALADAIVARRGARPQHWIAHSWGGVLMSSHLLRFPERIPLVASLVYFGAKRRVLVHNLARLWYIDLNWRLVGTLIVKALGYLPARRLGFGPDNETARSHAQSRAWVRDRPWVDPGDGFDYGAAARRAALPPIWYLAAVGDRCLGHPHDVRALAAESGVHEHLVSVLSRKAGNLHDYDHVSMLVHQDAAVDHFPAVEKWLRAHDHPSPGGAPPPAAVG